MRINSVSLSPFDAPKPNYQAFVQGKTKDALAAMVMHLLEQRDRVRGELAAAWTAAEDTLNDDVDDDSMAPEECLLKIAETLEYCLSLVNPTLDA